MNMHISSTFIHSKVKFDVAIKGIIYIYGINGLHFVTVNNFVIIEFKHIQDVFICDLSGKCATHDIPCPLLNGPCIILFH